MATQKRTKTVLTLAVVITAVLVFTATQANAATVNIQFDDFETIGNGGISQDAIFEAASGWRDVTNKFDSTPGNAGNNNARSDQAGHDGLYSNTNAGRAVRVRSSTGSMTLDNAMQLTSLGATSVTISLDLKEHSPNYWGGLFYSEDAAWTNPILIDAYDGSGANPLDFWVPKSYTITDGVGGINFTDDAWFIIGKRFQNDGSGGSNPTFHVYDNINIDAEVASSVIPEPSTFVLSTLGLLGLVGFRRRRSR